MDRALLGGNAVRQVVLKPASEEASSVKEASTVSTRGGADGGFLAVEETTPEAGDRLLSLDRARGFGIMLVVWGHLAGGAITGMPLWFLISISVIYGFHMPLFMYLSGFVFYLTRSQDRFWKALVKVGKVSHGSFSKFIARNVGICSVPFPRVAPFNSPSFRFVER